MSPDDGDGGIDERGEGWWGLRYRVNGKRHTKTVRGSVTEAKKELRRLLTSSHDGAFVAPDKLPLAAPVDIRRLEFIHLSGESAEPVRISVSMDSQIALRLAPFVIRWRPDASSDMLRKNLTCTHCGHRGASVQYPSWVDEEVELQPCPVDQAH